MIEYFDIILVFSIHPLVLFYLFGSLLMVIGLVAGGITLWKKLVWGFPVLFRPWHSLSANVYGGYYVLLVRDAL